MYPKFIKRDEADEHPAALVQNETEHNAQLIGWGRPPLKSETIKKAPEPPPGNPDIVEETVESLRAKLDAKGIGYSARVGIKKLQAILDESE